MFMSGGCFTALHWYEWQQGPDPAPESRYLFDTHYPDYFPARTDFKSAVKELANANIYTFPYINGRISDVNSDSYKADDGHQYCSKKTAVKLVDEDDPTPLVAYSEDYGSGTTFCVTNPFTPYWQTKIADTVEELVREYNVPGVYIDQIGSAVPKQCWDTAHEHSLGNGDFWTVCTMPWYTVMMFMFHMFYPITLVGGIWRNDGYNH